MNTSTRILAIRHGETAWNVDTRIQGHLDIPLNDTGLWQAQRVAQSIAAGDTVHAVYSSDLRRAHDTARAIADATGAPLQIHAGLRERGFGRFEGKTYTEVEQLWPEDSEHWRRRTPEWSPEGGESLLQVRERITQTLHDLASPHAGKQIVLVAHGGVMDQLYRLATGQDLQAPRTWQLGNAAINRLLWSAQGLSLVGWSDTSHLDTQSRDETSA
jgi:probable phosphoglycerate mutase